MKARLSDVSLEHLWKYWQTHFHGLSKLWKVCASSSIRYIAKWEYSLGTQQQLILGSFKDAFSAICYTGPSLNWRSYSQWINGYNWVKRNQLDATYFIILFNAQHVSDVNTSIFRSLRLIRSYFMDCIWFGVCWRSVSVWLWWCGVFMQSEALCFRLHKDTTPP